MFKTVLCILLLIAGKIDLIAQPEKSHGLLPRQEFVSILGKYAPSAQVDSLWQVIYTNYTGPRRFYHTPEHLDNFFLQLSKCRKDIRDWDAVIIAMVYHDVIYHSDDRRDEERSAEMAIQHLQMLPGFPDSTRKKIEALVLATKTHAFTNDNDTDLFNDCDMSILGLDRKIYETYVKNVRAEFNNAPGFDAGRKRVLQYFLGMDKIFKTPFFNNLYESSARSNISWEISTL